MKVEMKAISCKAGQALFESLENYALADVVL
jgi:hypothetical protein